MPDAAPEPLAGAPPEPALRDAVLDGAQSRPDWVPDRAGQAAMLSFLRDDRGALAAWFGSALRDVPPGRLRGWLRGAIDRDLLRLDRLIAAQLDAVLHHPRFRRLEGSWRGLLGLCAQAPPDAPVRIRTLSARWDELSRDLERAIEFDQSVFFRMVYENEFGRAGGEPFGLLVVDHEVSHQPAARAVGGRAPVDDVSVMKLLRSVAAAAFVPTVLGASPTLLGVDRFGDLALSHDIAGVFADQDHARWRSMTDAEDSRFLGVALPRVLARPPWTRTRTGGWYEEYAPDEERRCWSVAGYSLAAIVVRAHAAFRWPADIRGVVAGRVGGGLVTGLAHEPFRFGATTELPRGVTELGFTDAQERALVGANLIPLNTLPFGQAAFGAVRSLQARAAPAPGQRTTAAQANRRVSAELNAMLCASRFAHYVKIIGRDMTGGHAGAQDIERVLQDWLRRYTNSNISPDAGSRARHPLLSGRVQVRDNPARPGAMDCVVHLQPFHQLDDVSTVLRLTTSLAGPDGQAAITANVNASAGER